MASHATTDSGTLSFSVRGIFLLVSWGGSHYRAILPDTIIGGIDGTVLWFMSTASRTIQDKSIPFGTEMQFTFATAAAAITAGQDFMNQCALAKKAGFPGVV